MPAVLQVLALAVAVDKEEPGPQQCSERAQLCRELVRGQLEQGSHELQLAAQLYQNQFAKQEISLWIEMTHWTCYFYGRKLDEVAYTRKSGL